MITKYYNKAIYRLTNTRTGETYITNNLKEFSREFNIDLDGIRNLAYGKIKISNGWVRSEV